MIVTEFMYTIVDMKFSDWLFEQMNLKHWNQKQLVERSGLSRQAITNYFAGRIPDKKALRKIAKALDIDLETVYRAAGDLDPAENEKDEMIAEILHLMDDLPKEEQEDIIRYIELRRRITQEREIIEATKRNRTRPARSSS